MFALRFSVSHWAVQKLRFRVAFDSTEFNCPSLSCLRHMEFVMYADNITDIAERSRVLPLRDGEDTESTPAPSLLPLPPLKCSPCSLAPQIRYFALRHKVWRINCRRTTLYSFLLSRRE
ncbi:hypothetical protein TraAM80_07673 [Trypanosoma rangeli]|uniref:Uncharacterized protein n=1 Tax=Trypanosoma rangeli TaxID=5698 RepID=A0A3R7KS76_TRYRA|nr:uncharacterized protein TraAM80_07673 [Trypanosoma rangeli]RNF00318.1 hypothetical protein TraAM80_07673 [Trypanosoma rangeli]|eukprot:RNF00318.1 hypothetical protein TraAM80_07673 [Trypanosoma rangeli]